MSEPEAELIVESAEAVTSDPLVELNTSLIDLGLENIKGVGPKTREKLKACGVETMLDLAVSLPKELEESLGGTEEKAAAMITSARVYLEENGLLERGFVPAIEMLHKRSSRRRATTGSPALDTLLGGGVETQAITEFYGDYGSGKTQLCHTLCATCHSPADEGGLGGGAIYFLPAKAGEWQREDLDWEREVPDWRSEDTERQLDEEDLVDTARRFEEHAKARGLRLELPVDHVVAPAVEEGTPHETLAVGDPAIGDRIGVDIGYQQ